MPQKPCDSDFLMPESYRELHRQVLGSATAGDARFAAA